MNDVVREMDGRGESGSAGRESGFSLTGGVVGDGESLGTDVGAGSAASSDVRESELSGRAVYAM